jgi:hypothetical protein
MEKVIPIPLGDYLGDLARPDQDRDYTTFDALDLSDSTCNTEVLCSTDDPEEATVHRIGKNVLQLSQERKKLSPPEIRVFNSLLINRNLPLLTTDIQEITGRSKTLVHRALKQLAGKLQDTDGQPLVRLVDMPQPGTKQHYNGYILDSDLQIAASGESGQSDLATRRHQWLKTVLPHYDQEQELYRKINSRTREALFSYGKAHVDIATSRYHVYKSPEFFVLYERIDHAMTAFENTGDPLNPEVQEGVVAWYGAYYSALGLLRRELKRFEGRLKLYDFANEFSIYDLHDDFFQIGAMALWKASVGYDPAKSSFPYYSLMRINSSLKHAKAAILGKARGQVSTAPVPTTERLSLDEDGWEYDNLLPVADNTEHIPMRLLHDSIAGHVINHPLLRASEKLVLSLHFGIYCNDLDGVELTTSEGNTLFYDQKVSRNVVFRDGVSMAHIAPILGLSLTQTKRIRDGAMEKARDIALTKVYADIDYKAFTSTQIVSDIFE